MAVSLCASHGKLNKRPPTAHCGHCCVQAVSGCMKVQEAAKCRLVCSRFASHMSLRKMRISLPRPSPQQQETLLQQLSEGSPYHRISHLHATLTLPMGADLVPLAVALAGLPSLQAISLRSELAPQLAAELSLTTPLQALDSSCSTAVTTGRKQRSGWRWLTSSARSSNSDAGTAASTASAAASSSSSTASSRSNSGRPEVPLHTAMQALETSHPWMSLAVSQGPKLRSLDLDLHAWPSPMQFHLLLTRLTGLTTLAIRHAPVKVLQALSAVPQLQQLTFIGQLDQAVGKGCLHSGLLPSLPGVTRLVMLCLPMGLRQQELEDIQAGSSTQLVSSSILRSCPALVDLRSDLELGPAVAGLTGLTTLQGAHPAALPALAAAAAAAAAGRPAPGAVRVEQQEAAEPLAPAAGGEVTTALGDLGTPLRMVAAEAAGVGEPGTGAAAVGGSTGLRHLGVGVDTPWDCEALSRLTHLESLMLWPSSERAVRAAEYQDSQQQRAAVEAAAAVAAAAAAAGALPEAGELEGGKGAPDTLEVVYPGGGGDSSSLSSTCTSGIADVGGAFSSVGSSSMGSRSRGEGSRPSSSESRSQGEGSRPVSFESTSPPTEPYTSPNLFSPLIGTFSSAPASSGTTQQRRKQPRRLSARLLQQWGRATAALQRLVPQGSVRHPSGQQPDGKPLGSLSTPAVSSPACLVAASSQPSGSSILREVSMGKRSVCLAPAAQAAADADTGTAAAAPGGVGVSSPDVRLLLGGGLEQRLVRLRLLGGWQLTEGQAGALKAACPRLQELSVS
jgi:hypothetical protein